VLEQAEPQVVGDVLRAGGFPDAARGIECEVGGIHGAQRAANPHRLDQVSIRQGVVDQQPQQQGIRGEDQAARGDAARAGGERPPPAAQRRT
jgi:hypothetical protein